MRASTARWLCGLAVLRAAVACAAAPAPSTADTKFANYAFASELGSGIYEIGDTTVQVYQLQPGYPLRAAEARATRPGITLVLPLTVGFFNFQTSELVHLEIPRSIGALSLEPGVELDYWLNPAWHVYPYVKAGATFASSADINAEIFGVGVRSDYRFAAFDALGLWRAELAHAGVHYYHSAVPNDSFTRLRDGLELRRNFVWRSQQRGMQLAPYAVTDLYLDAPAGPASGIGARTVQFEGGLMFAASPMWRIHGHELPRIGIGYRVAGILSGWRLVLGDPF